MPIKNKSTNRQLGMVARLTKERDILKRELREAKFTIDIMGSMNHLNHIDSTCRKHRGDTGVGRSHLGESDAPNDMQ